MTKYLSIIIPTRDDDFGIEFKGFINSLSYLLCNLSDYKISSEIIIVDWNSEKKPTAYHFRIQRELEKIKYDKDTVTEFALPRLKA